MSHTLVLSYRVNRQLLRKLARHPGILENGYAIITDPYLWEANDVIPPGLCADKVDEGKLEELAIEALASRQPWLLILNVSQQTMIESVTLRVIWKRAKKFYAHVIWITDQWPTTVDSPLVPKDTTVYVGWLAHLRQLRCVYDQLRRFSSDFTIGCSLASFMKVYDEYIKSHYTYLKFQAKKAVQKVDVHPLSRPSFKASGEFMKSYRSLFE